MIISNDYKFMFIGNPKTGTRTAKQVLSPYGIFLGEHFDPNISLVNARRINPSFDISKIEKIYVFWRDPVERFISGINFLRSTGVGFLIRHRREWFPGIDLSMYDEYPLASGVNPTLIDPTTIPPEVFSVAALISTEQLFGDEFLMQSYGLLHKQSRWITPIETVLDFANFDSNMRIVMNSFGVPANTDIPVLNSSEIITTTLSPELEAKVKAYYAEDYNLKPV